MLGLAGCSTVKLAYNNFPELAYWWLDGYFDFESSQSARARDELDRLLAWHRRAELPQWIALLQKARALAPADSTPAQACELGEAMRTRLLAVAEQAEPPAAELALTLTSAQLEHLQQKYAKLNADYRSDWLNKSREAQQTKRYEQWLDRSEDFYGPLDETQKKAMRQMMADSAFSPALFDTERKRRQGALLAGLRGLAAMPNPTPSDARKMLQAYVRTVSEAPPGRWREQQQALWQESCSNFATLHNMTNPAQREQAVRRLGRYEADLRELAGQQQP
ncbi:hypothetical protein SAMN05444747_108270 [Variovorax sp. OV329]|nr:hypothetical protein SAMN05444747_108270 [Variovorax sp. OV329]